MGHVPSFFPPAAVGDCCDRRLDIGRISACEDGVVILRDAANSPARRKASLPMERPIKATMTSAEPRAVMPQPRASDSRPDSPPSAPPRNAPVN
jgi:hypothetical protein